MDPISALPDLPPLGVTLAGFQPGDRPLGDWLLRLEACSENDVSSALERQISSGGLLGAHLVATGAVSLDALMMVLAWQRLARDPEWERMGRVTWHPDLHRTEVEDRIPYEVVALPRAGTFVRLSPAERAIADAWTRCATWDALMRDLWLNLRILAMPEQVLALATLLHGKGILVQPGETRVVGPRPARDGLAWRLPLADPGPMLHALSPLLRTTTRLPFVLGLWLPMVAAAALTAVIRRDEVASALATLGHGVHWTWALALYLAVSAIVLVHEFGHAAVCAALGAPVREIGVMIYLGLPLGYCDVSGAHLLPRRQDRIAVTLGGLYYQIGLSALCFLAWGWLPLAPALRAWVLDLGLIAGGSILFDLNPFARLDGYYLLLDALGIPNLRERSFRYVARRLTGREAEPVPPRVRRWFWIYGVVGPLVTAMVAVIGLMWWWHLAFG